MQPSAQTKSSEIVGRLNDYLAKAKFQNEQDINILKLKREIESLKSVSPHEYLSLMSCFSFVTGNFERMQELGRNLINIRGNEVCLIRYLLSLTNAGFEEETVSALTSKTIDFSSTENCQQKLFILNKCGYLRASVEFEALLIRSKTKTQQDIDMISSATACLAIIERAGIAESALTSMISQAGVVARKRKLMLPATNKYYTFDNQQISVLIPVKTTPDEAAEMDWELSDLLVSKFPSQTLRHILISFTTETTKDD